MSHEPKWLWEEGFVYQGMWEPSYFMKQLGRPYDEAAWRFQHSPEFVRELHARGVNHIWTHHWKGYGLEFEKREQDLNRPLVAEAHRLGMRVVAYCTFGTIVPETFAFEVPDCETWAQVAENGQPAGYSYNGFQCFRVRPCYNCKEWRAYMKRVVDVALVDLDMDGIHFDNVYTNPEPDTCRCPRCVAGFRAYLDREFGGGSPETRALGERLFGHTDFRHAKLPWFNRWNQAVMQREINVSMQQAWVRYRAELLCDALAEMRAHIKGRKPDALLEANSGKGFGSNMEYLNSVAHELVYPMIDMTFDENAAKRIGTGPHGQYITRIREYKFTRAAGMTAIVYCDGDPLSLSESFAFNPNGFGGGGTPEINAWYHAHKRLQAGADTLSEVAVLRHRESLGLSMLLPHAAVITAEEVLIENRIPFDVVWKTHLGDLSRYRLLVLAETECLSAEEATQILRFVEAGGAVLAVGKVGHFDNWRRLHRREQAAMETGAGERGAAERVASTEASAMRPILYPLFGEAVQADARVQYGAGRAAALADFDYVVKPGGGPEFWTVSPQYWAMPKNAAAFLDALEWCLGGRRRLRVATASRIVAEHTRAGDVEIVHLVHLDGKQATASARIELIRDVPVREVLAMDFGGTLAPVSFEAADGVTRIAVDGIQLSRVIVLKG
jgi:hypothetical protein